MFPQGLQGPEFIWGAKELVKSGAPQCWEGDGGHQKEKKQKILISH